MGVKFTNNAKTTLASGINSSATSVSVVSSSGFPSLSGSDYFYATLDDDDSNLEIVKVTNVSGTTWTITRAQDNTTAKAYSSGDKIELRASAGLFTDLLNEKAPKADPTFTGNITIGSAEISETELEILDGATVTTDELNKLDGTTATTASLTWTKDLYDSGVTATEFDYLDGVSSNLQTQLNAKMVEPSGFARGSIIIGDSSGDSSNLGIGTSGYVLKSDGTDIAWAEDATTTTTNFTRQSFTGDGDETDFTLSQTPSSENDLIVFIEGVFQTQSTYSLSGNTLIFSTAPADTREIVVYHVRAAVSGSNLNHDQFTASGSAAFTLSISPVNENNTQVFIDGVYQQKTDYSVSGTTLTFDTAPGSGATVEVMTFTQTDINVPTDDSVSEVKLKVSNSPSNGYFLSAQSGNTGGLTWAEANNYVHPNHSGEVTSSADGATVIADNTVDEANLKVSNSPTNGYFLSAQSGNTGGLTWAEVDTSTLAPLASPTFTGNPVAPTQSASDNSTKIATTAYADTAVSNIVDSAPSTLNTLNELAAALGDDVNFSTTVTNSIATKLPLAGGTMTGDLTMGSNQIIFNNNSQAIQIKDAAGTASYVLYQDNADTLVVGNGTNVEKIRLDTGGNEGALVIDTDGKVLIGTAEAATMGKAIVMAMVFG